MSLNKLPEYMALGLPIIVAGDFPFNPVQEARCGCIVAPEDCECFAGEMMKLSTMGLEERTEMGRRGRAFAQENFDYGGLMARYSKLLLDDFAE